MLQNPSSPLQLLPPVAQSPAMLLRPCFWPHFSIHLLRILNFTAWFLVWEEFCVTHLVAPHHLTPTPLSSLSRQKQCSNTCSLNLTRKSCFFGKKKSSLAIPKIMGKV